MIRIFNVWENTITKLKTTSTWNLDGLELCEIPISVGMSITFVHTIRLSESRLTESKGNNDKLKKVLQWNYSVKLQDGIKKTYSWIYDNMIKNDPDSMKFTKADLKNIK